MGIKTYNLTVQVEAVQVTIDSLSDVAKLIDGIGTLVPLSTIEYGKNLYPEALIAIRDNQFGFITIIENGDYIAIREDNEDVFLVFSEQIFLQQYKANSNAD